MQCSCIPSKCNGFTPEARIMQSSVVHQHQLYVYGGTGGALGSRVSSNLYRFDLHHTELGWVSIPTASIISRPPRARCGHTANIIQSNQMIVFGGQGYSLLNPLVRETLGDMWTMDLKQDVKQWHRMKVYHGTLPPPRRNHTMVVMGSNGAGKKIERLVLFGGEGLERSFSTPSFLDDTWSYNVSKKRWTLLTTENKPSPRSLHTATAIDNHRMVVYGGISCNFKGSKDGPMLQLKSVDTSAHALPHVHVLDVDRPQWTIQSTTGSTGDHPGCLYGHSGTRITQGNGDVSVVYYGGYPSGKTPSPKVYVLNTSTWAFTNVTMSGYLKKLQPRYCHAAVSLPSSKKEKNSALSSTRILFYGGSNFSKYSTGDLYTCKIIKQKRSDLAQRHNPDYLNDLRRAISTGDDSVLEVLKLPATLLGSESEEDNDEEDNHHRVSTSRLQQIVQQRRSAQTSIRLLRKYRHSSTSLKAKLTQPKLTMTQQQHMSQGLSYFDTSIPTSTYQKRDLLENIHPIYDEEVYPETKTNKKIKNNQDKNTMGGLDTKNALMKQKQKQKQKQKRKTLRHNHSLFNGPLTYKHRASMVPKNKLRMQVTVKGSTGKIIMAEQTSGKTKIRKMTMKRGMYGEMLHLQYMSRTRPMSAPRKRGSTSNRHINSSSRRKRPHSAFNLSSPTSATGCITQTSMQSLKSLPVLSMLNTKKEDEEDDVVGERFRHRRGEGQKQQHRKQRPQSGTCIKKRDTTRSGRRPQSAAPNRRTRTVQFDLER